MTGWNRRCLARRAALIAIAAMGAAASGLLVAPVTSGLAPVAIGNGTAIDVRPLDTSIGVSQASAGENSASSDAVAVRALGVEVADSHSNATSNESETESTADVPVPLTSGGAVKVTPRSTSASSTPQSSQSSAHSDLVTLHLPGLVEMEVLSSDAEAVWTPGWSASRSEADGATLDLLAGELVIVLMHSESSSDGSGRLYLIRLNDAELFESRESRDPRALTIDVPDIFTIELARTSAQGGGWFTGEVVETAFPDDEADVEAFGDVVREASERDEPSVLPSKDTAASVPSDGGAFGILPTTGSPLMLIVFIALTLILGGAVMSSSARSVLARA